MGGYTLEKEEALSIKRYSSEFVKPQFPSSSFATTLLLGQENRTHVQLASTVPILRQKQAETRNSNRNRRTN
jgi:hypothetical protein